jgi:hypothetical protein
VHNIPSPALPRVSRRPGRCAAQGSQRLQAEACAPGRLHLLPPQLAAVEAKAKPWGSPVRTQGIHRSGGETADQGVARAKPREDDGRQARAMDYGGHHAGAISRIRNAMASDTNLKLSLSLPCFFSRRMMLC